ncbi:hypothetical protein [Paenibacillus dakarensis]|uniref:hypothetical protein n=1 Tax=Paenibacillus dakarensis TaxID=1527293 RepID=UPI0006D53351|nr:hypothetical protein [Paenibacillus dakarensis]
MRRPVSKAEVKQYVGKQIYAYTKDGSFVTGKLVRVSGNRLLLEPVEGKKVKTKALAPLVLFDLLAIGTSPFGFGGFGPGFVGPGFVGPGFVGPGFGFGGYPGGFFW